MIRARTVVGVRSKPLMKILFLLTKKNYSLMKTKNLVKSLMIAIMLVTASLLLTLLRLSLVLLAWPPYKLLEKTNRLYQETMEETCMMLSL